MKFASITFEIRDTVKRLRTGVSIRLVRARKRCRGPYMNASIQLSLIDTIETLTGPFGDGRRLLEAGDQLANFRRLSTDLDFFAHTKHALRNYRKASSGILFYFFKFCVPMMGMRLCEEQARIGRVR